jgi:hypothetical protein
MDLKYLFLPPSYTADIAELIKAAFCSAISIVRWSPRDAWCPPADCSVRNATVYGGLRICRKVAENLGGSLVEPAADLLCAVPYEYVRRRVELTTLGRVRSVAEPTFIKPATIKAFPAAVYQPGTPRAFDAYEDDLPVLVSEIVEWAVEVRLFIVDGCVRASTVYRHAPSYTPTGEDVQAAARACEEMFGDSRVRLPSAVVLDVGLIPDRGWSIVEANPLNASSFYDCDADTILHLLPRGIVAPQAR